MDNANVFSQARGSSLPSIIEVLERRRIVALVAFIVFAIVACAFVTFYKVKYASISHVVLVNDANGRDPSVAGVDMPTIITGSAVLEDVRKKLRLDASINDLRKAVSARIAPKSSLMTISVQDKNPDRSMAINNAIADTFSKHYSRLAGARYDIITQRLNDDVTRARTRLALAERNLETASAGASYVGSQASLDASAAHLGDLQQSRGMALAQYTTDAANLHSDRELPSRTAKIVQHEILSSTPAYAQADAAVGKDVADYTVMRAGVTARYPGITGYIDKIGNEQVSLDTLRAEALAGRDAYSPTEANQIIQTAKDDAAVRGDQVRLDALDAQVESMNKKLTQPSTGAPSIGALRADRDAAEAQLQALSLRLSNAIANQAEASALGAVVVVDRATEARRVLVGPVLLLALGMLASAILAIAAAYVSEWMVPRLLGPGDVEGVYGRPILATLRAARNPRMSASA